MTRLLAVPLDASDVFLMTFMILQDSYMEPTRVGSDILLAKVAACIVKIKVVFIVV